MRYRLEQAWLGEGTGIAADVVVEVADGRITAVTPAVTLAAAVGPDPGVVRLPGLTLPGLANAHSHAFHRVLRGRAQGGAGTFWTWREAMYAVAGRLDPDGYYLLARAVYAEMALAGITCVGEFHYLHHAPGGVRYNDPNTMGHALLAAAHDAGIRITLLDTLYLTSTVDGQPLAGPQLRFGDGGFEAWAQRRAELKPGAQTLIGAAAHSVRAVPEPDLAAMAGAVTGPIHVHLSEQLAENEACLGHYGCSPTELLHRTGLLGPATTAVHATHLSGTDLRLLTAAATAVCLCPTTERDLADGIGPAHALHRGGSPICLGSDSQAVVDLFEEARGVELHERLRSGRRGHFSTAQLLTAATAGGHRSLGWPDAGELRVGARADLVTVSLDSVRTVGAEPTAAAVFAAAAADVTHVVVDGRVIVHDGHHVTLDVVADLRAAMGR